MSKNEDTKDLETKSGTYSLSRRRFLQILGSASAVTAVGCTTPSTQNILSNVKGDPEAIPGVAVWYSSTCTECSAGCGTLVRTREGRAVKVEGNPDNPINRGGLCALGQSALQNLYDPDRIRQPLKKVLDGAGNATFVPVSWDEAYATVASALKDPSAKRAFISGETSGALDELLGEWCEAFRAQREAYDLMQPTAVAKAAELTFGTYGIPSYSIDRAEMVLNFGADFLETWVSPVEYARDWAVARKAEKPARVVHIEPRLSLTGANADTWLSAKPGTEVKIALALLKLMLEAGRGTELPAATLAGMKHIVSAVSVTAAASESGVPQEKILLIGQWLKEAKSSLVLAGGVASATVNPLPLLVVANLLNLVLGNFGRTVSLDAMRVPKSSPSKLVALVDQIKKGEIKTIFVHGANPAFSLASDFGLEAAALVKNGQSVISFASHLDETAQLADLILPASSGLESWGDVRVVPGVYSLVQPSMTPVFDTRDIGDILLGLSRAAGNTTTGKGSDNFLGYLKASWEKLRTTLGVNLEAKRFWLESVERGGYFPARVSQQKPVQVSESVFSINFASAAAPVGELLLYPYLSVRSFDGRAANRPWLQELPDPITSIVWDSWVEIHPETANEKGVAQGDLVTVRNAYGEISSPAYLTEHVQRGVIAVPIGQGHKDYGRFAQKVGAGNVLSLVAPSTADKIFSAGDSISLLTAGVTLVRARGKAQLVVTQGSDSQHGRELARTRFVDAAGVALAAEQHVEHEPKQMYKQREHPLYEWALNVDLNACTGCSACVVACYAENNIPVVGKTLMWQGREMSWLRIERYMDQGHSEELSVSFLPMMCQHCHNAPCEPVCPVYATYHNDEGLNVMVYNRCVGTRYCSNNCSYKVRRFNFTETEFPEPLTWQLNPDVTKRVGGIMEKCSLCLHRITEAKDHAKDEGRLVLDGEIQPACVQSCPTKAITFGNANDAKSKVSELRTSDRVYKVLDAEINTQPAVTYLERVKYKA